MTRLSPWLVLVVAGLLLVTFGGAIVAAPLTLPLLVVIGRRTTAPPVRILAAAIAALTAAEVAWALVYVAIGESEPWIWALPVAAGVLTVVLIVRP